MSDTENPTEAQAADVTAPAAQEPADDFDKERAMATIQKLRSFEKDAKAKLTRLAELEAQAAEREQADLSAAQKAEKRAAELEAKFQQAQSQLKKAMLKDAVRAASDALNLSFAPGALDDALNLGRFDALEIEDDGNVKGLNSFLKELKTSRPYLFASVKAQDIGAQERGKPGKEADLSGIGVRWGIKVE